MFKTQKSRRLTAILAALVALFALAGAAAAHPLGNFTVSRYSALTLRDTAVDVLYIVDMAEIPTVQEQQAMDTDGDGTVSAAEESTWLTATVATLAANLNLTVDGAPIALTPGDHNLSYPPGQGGLATLRLELSLSGALPPADDEPRALTYEDNNFAGRIGWQEIIATAADGSLLDSTVPATDLSDQLRNYPADLLQAPSAVSRAEMRYAPVVMPADDGRQTTEGGQEAAAVSANRFSQDEFANLLNRTLDTPGALAGALLVAITLGAAHALTPGHGKSIVGAYLVGSRGKARHALFLGLTTTVTHTAGVFALGFLVLAASEFILPEKLYPWLGVMSGLLVAFIGLSIFRGHFRNWRAIRRGEQTDPNYHFHFGKGHSHGPDGGHHHGNERDLTGLGRPVRSEGAMSGSTLAFAGIAQPSTATLSPALHTHDHSHHGHAHDGNHAHDYDHTHDHDPDSAAAEGNALGWRNLLALGVSGGLLPCPSALILMLSAIALHQVGLGLVLIVAFSIGLAAVLTGIGLMMVYAGRLLERLPVRQTSLATRLLPAASAAFITLAGLLITLRALQEAGVL